MIDSILFPCPTETDKIKDEKKPKDKTKDGPPDPTDGTPPPPDEPPTS